MWSASLSNIQLLTVFVKACLRHCPESLVGKDRYHYINNINNKRYTFINSETQGAGGLLPRYNSSFTLPQTPPIWVYFVTLHIASSFEFVRCQCHIVQSPSQLWDRRQCSYMVHHTHGMAGSAKFDTHANEFAIDSSPPWITPRVQHRYPTGQDFLHCTCTCKHHTCNDTITCSSLYLNYHLCQF